MNKSKGQIAQQLGFLVVGVVMLFIGLFMINAVSGTIPEGSIYDCTYATTTNSTTVNVNATYTANRTFTATTFSQYCGPAGGVDGGGADLIVTIINASAGNVTGTVTVLFNTVSVGTITAPTVNSTTTTFSNLTVVPSVINNVSYIGDTENLTVYSDILATSSTDSYTAFTGTIWNNLVGITGTAFSVMGLVIIIVALAMAIGSLRGVARD